MLHITPEAGLAIRKLVEAQGAGADGGLRVEARADEPDFAMSVAAMPDETDLVVTEGATGSRVMLDNLTAEYVADKTLTVRDTIEGTARFELSTQGITSE
jgi:hypothetical protein